MKLRFAAPGLALFVFNLALVGRLAVVERTMYHGSIEGAFIGLARFFSEHPNPFGWYPYWYCGTPAQFTYTSGLHYINALAIRLLPMFSPGQTYHAVAAVMYAFGSVTAAYLTYFFTRNRCWAFGVGMLYSLGSLEAGSEGPWRLRVLVQVGEGPHVASLMLVPLAVCALWKAVQECRFPALFGAAILMASTVLINWVGAFALAVVVFCLLLTVARMRGAIRIVWAGILAYLLAAFWITPAFVRKVALNAQTVGGHYEYQWRMLVLLAGALAGMAFLRWLFPAVPGQPYLCFLALNSFFFGYLAITAYWLGLDMIPQSHRYVPELELFSILLLCEIVRLSFRGQAVVVAAAALAAMVLFQSRHYLRSPYRMLRPALVQEWFDYKIARWLGANVSPESRVYIVGSEGMSLNEWVDVAQVKGWFDPGVRNQLILDLSYQISTSKDAPEGRDGEIAVNLLYAVGARYAVVHGPQSNAAYQDFPRHRKFEGLLPAVYRPGPDEAIYEVPGVRLAHLVRRDELATKTPVNGLDLGPIERYVAAVRDASRPALQTRWITPNELQVQGQFPEGGLVSLQVSYDEGWRAYQDAARVPIEQDHLGFMVLAPRPDPSGGIRLEYAGNPEQRFCAWISCLPLGCGVAAMVVRTKRNDK